MGFTALVMCLIVLCQAQDPVSDVKLEAAWCRPEWPNLVVTCTAVDGRLSRTFICDTRTCYHKGGESGIQVNLNNGAVNCYYNNKVGSTKTIEDLCGKDRREVDIEDDESEIFLIFVVFLLLMTCGVLAAVVYSRRLRQQCKTGGRKNTGPTELQTLHRDTCLEQGPTNDTQGRMRNVFCSVETGTDLQLNVGHAVHLNQNDELCWKFKKKVNIVKLTQTSGPVYHPDYAGRAEFSPQDQSLLLKNVQKTDSGEYRAVFSGDIDRVLVKYQVTVQGG